MAEIEENTRTTSRIRFKNPVQFSASLWEVHHEGNGWMWKNDSFKLSRRRGGKEGREEWERLPLGACLDGGPDLKRLLLLHTHGGEELVSEPCCSRDGDGMASFLTCIRMWLRRKLFPVRYIPATEITCTGASTCIVAQHRYQSNTKS